MAVCAVFLFTLLLPPALRAADQGHGGHSAAAATGQTHQGRGIVEAVDPAKGTVTVEHEAIESLRWPSMVMTLNVQDPAMLKGLKEGDQVEFNLLVKGKEEYYITRIEPVR